MGNICGPSKCSKHGFFGSIWHSLWRSRSPELIQYEKRKPRNQRRNNRTAKVTKPVPSSSPRVFVVGKEDPKPVQSEKLVVVVTQESKPTQGNPTSSVRNPQHKGKPSAGRVADKVLKNTNGKLKDHFNLGVKLGQGQFGTTSICVDKKNGKQFACKSIAKRKLVTIEDVEDVRREVEIMHHLSGHPNVISIQGAYEDAYEVHLVMELCSGGELFDRITTKGQFSEREAASLLKTIASVIEACHSLGVIHRDLKPENFLFVNRDEDSPLKAIDFGLSTFFKPGDIISELVGSPYYVAPEVLARYYGPEADIWSAGVILYVLLSGVPPFYGETENDVFREILQGELDFTFDPWPVISGSAKELISKMLLRNINYRITAHEILCHPWISVDGVAPDKPLDPAVLTRLTQFSAMNKLKKMALKVIASKLSEEEIAGLKQMFKTIDTDNSGYLTFDELKEGLKTLGADLDESEIHDLMQAADIDNSGTIDYEEFVAATLHFTKADREDRLFAAFSYFDKDGSGYITFDELQQACEEFGVDVVHLDEIIKDVDQNDDGRIDYGEFVAMMHKGSGSVARNQSKNNFIFGFREPVR